MAVGHAFDSPLWVSRSTGGSALQPTSLPVLSYGLPGWDLRL